jgi:ribosomal protein L16 Arg81 hydroxylase
MHVTPAQGGVQVENETLFGGMAPGHFVENYYGQLPFSRRGGAAHLAPLLSWPVVGGILAQPGVDALLARDGEAWRGELPDYAGVRELYAGGYSLVVRHAERHEERLAALAARFERDFGGPANLHLVMTPAQRTGFGWHYDSEEVFIVQAHGTKEYFLRANTVNPWPLAETMPRDLGFEGEVTVVRHCTLGPGDWLYVPAGWWHVAHAGALESHSISIGVSAPSGLELLDFLRRKLRERPDWRRRLPAPGLAPAGSMEQVLAQLGGALADLLRDESLVRAFVEERRNPPAPLSPAGARPLPGPALDPRGRDAL